MLFSTVVADPPWQYGDAKIRGGAGNHYDLMPLESIKALVIPTEGNAHLYLWTTNSFMVEAHQVAACWGFTVKTILTWGKITQSNFLKAATGTGHYFRGATEHVLFGVKGSLPLNRLASCRTTLMLGEREKHSRKPDWFFKLVEGCSPGPYLEMFSRAKREGWSCWGNQIDSDVQIGGR